MASFSTLMRPPKAQEQLSFATPYPVFFSRDSKEKPQNAGSVGVNASMNFRRLQADLAAKLGLEGHQASQLQIVIVCSRASGNGEQVQQIPIHENTNFCVILNQHNPSRDKVVHFLVSIKDAAVDALRQRAAEASQHTKSTSSPAASDATLEAAKAQLLQQLAHAASMSKLNGVGARPVGQWGALPQGGNLAAQFTTPGWSQHRGMAGGAQQWQIGAVRGLQNQTGKVTQHQQQMYPPHHSFTMPLRQQLQQQHFPGALVHRMHPPAKPDKAQAFGSFTHLQNPGAAIQAVANQANKHSNGSLGLQLAHPLATAPATSTAPATAAATAATAVAPAAAEHPLISRLFRAACQLEGVRSVTARLSEFWMVSLNDPVLHKPKVLWRQPSPFGPIGKLEAEAR